MKAWRIRRIDPNTVVLLKQIGIGLFVCGLFALTITGVWYGSRLSALTISTVEISGGDTVRHDLIEELVWSELSGEYIGLVPHQFAWTYPHDAIVARLETIERLHTITVDRVDRTTLVVRFSEYKPQALWCQAVDSADCYFLSTEGFAFASAPNLHGGSFMRFIHLQEMPERGQTLIDPADFQTALALTNALAEQGWFVSHIEVDRVGDAFLKVVGGGELKVSLGMSPEDTTENFLVILSSDEFVDLAPGNFAYVDLRFGNKVFVNEELAAPEGAAASSTATSSESQSE